MPKDAPDRDRRHISWPDDDTQACRPFAFAREPDKFFEQERAGEAIDKSTDLRPALFGPRAMSDCVSNARRSGHPPTHPDLWGHAPVRLPIST
jgi:hypothetical protein